MTEVKGEEFGPGLAAQNCLLSGNLMLQSLTHGFILMSLEASVSLCLKIHTSCHHRSERPKLPLFLTF